MIESGQWTPAQCAAVPLVVQFALWGGVESGAGQGGKRMTRKEQIDALQQRRAAKGLPPLPLAEIEENERRFAEAVRRGPNG